MASHAVLGFSKNVRRLASSCNARYQCIGLGLGRDEALPASAFRCASLMELICGGRLGGVAGIYRDSKRIQ
jgi:hypothetical protein